MSFPSHAVTKIVPLKFHGIDLSLKVSHALFSSHKVDEGTLLLLKTIVQQKAVPEVGKLLDVGCGTGPLVLALKKRYPVLEAFAQDRLALACAFTAENARCNGVKIEVCPSLMLESSFGCWDLLVCNIPAKAGAPVLEDFFLRSATALADSGRAAVVIVNTLADFVADFLEKSGIPVLFCETGRQHTVFHYGKKEAVTIPDDPFPEVYLRASMPWTVTTRQAGLDTFWGLPNFDSVDYRLQVSQSLWEKKVWRPGSLLIWEPGQGHAAVAFAEVCPQSKASSITLASGDLLSLKASSHNLNLWGFDDVKTYCVSDLNCLVDTESSKFQNLFVALQSEPEIPWVNQTFEALRCLAKIGAHLLINGTSTDLARFLENHKGFRIVGDRRYRGWRAVLLERLA